MAGSLSWSSQSNSISQPCQYLPIVEALLERLQDQSLARRSPSFGTRRSEELDLVVEAVQRVSRRGDGDHRGIHLVYDPAGGSLIGRRASKRRLGLCDTQPVQP